MFKRNLMFSIDDPLDIEMNLTKITFIEMVGILAEQSSCFILVSRVWGVVLLW
jgi:hypothetical protein